MNAQINLVNTNLAFVMQDTLFSNQFIDVDEWRGKPIRHRYVHGGFKGTETRFSFYFPTIRVVSQRAVDAKTLFARIQNLGRVRVVVN